MAVSIVKPVVGTTTSTPAPAPAPAVEAQSAAHSQIAAHTIAQQQEQQQEQAKRVRGTGSGRHGGARPRPPLIDLHQPGHLSVGNVMALLGIRSSTTLYARVTDGRIPPPDGRAPRPYWRTETIAAYLAGGQP